MSEDVEKAPVDQRAARRQTAVISRDRWQLAEEFRTWYESLLFPETPWNALERWMGERFPKLAPVDRGMLAFACLREENGIRRRFRRHGGSSENDGDAQVAGAPESVGAARQG